MPVLNVHERSLACSEAALGGLIDQLACDDDQLWPVERWPAMRFDRPLAIGAIGGHGPVRYVVSDYVPARWIRFRFTAPRGFDGFHEFSISHEADDRQILRHVLVMHTRGAARLSWPLIFRPLHGALVEDGLDHAEHALLGHIEQPVRWTFHVQILRRLLARRPRP